MTSLNKQQQSRLGQILVKKNLISQEQLSQAISHQNRTGKRLGDILTDWDLISHQHVQNALGVQRKLRIAASIVTAMLAPLHAYASTPVPHAVITQNDAVQQPASKMVAMSEADLDGVSAQGLNEQLLEIVSDAGKTKDGAEVLGTIAKVFNPLLGFLNSDTTISGVVYDPARSKAIINPNGSITLPMPVSIAEVRIANIRPVAVGGVGGPSMGTITLSDIRFNNTKVTLSLHP
ncbi:MAG: hypothetical protein RIR09_2476 [Pseudomonadota bacterium]